MTRFVVFEPPAQGGGAGRGASERAVFVRDAFSVWALLFPWIWLLRYGLLVWALVVFLLCLGLGRMAQSGLAMLALPLFLLLGLLVALEGPQLRARRFVRRRYAETAAVDAKNAEEAAVLYYAASGLSRVPGGEAPNKALPWRFEAPAPAGARRWWKRGAKA